METGIQNTIADESKVFAILLSKAMHNARQRGICHFNLYLLEVNYSKREKIKSHLNRKEENKFHRQTVMEQCCSISITQRLLVLVFLFHIIMHTCLTCFYFPTLVHHSIFPLAKW